MKHRLERVNSLIKEELAKLIEKEVESPGVLITITEVLTSKNMSQAIVGLSFFPSNKSKEVLKAMNQNRDLERQLRKNLNIKPMPKIVFEIDRGLEKAARIEELLRKE